jgi:hypothetical protein
LNQPYESKSPCALLQLALLAGCLALSNTTPLIGQKSKEPSPPKYDVSTESKMKGVVEEINLPPKGSEKEVIHLTVKGDAESEDIYLCPESFLKDMGVSFSKGDNIGFTASKVKQNGADILLAREVVRGNETLVLRDDKGVPVWTPHR